MGKARLGEAAPMGLLMDSCNPKKYELLAARAIVRVLDDCGDNVEKKERFVAERLHHLALTVEDQQETIRELRRLLVRRNGQSLRKGNKRWR